MYTTYYEISKFLIPIDLLLGITIVVGGVAAIIKGRKNGATGKHHLFEKTVGGVLAFFGVIMTVCALGNGGSAARPYAKQYYQGKYRCVEGKVSNYIEVDGQTQSFQVNEVTFNDVGSINIGHHIKDHSIIKQEGQQVRIAYIYSEQYQMNLIMKVEVRP